MDLSEESTKLTADTSGEPCEQCTAARFQAHKASSLGHIDCLKRILAKGSNPQNLLDDYRNNPLHAAAIFGQPEAVRYLMEKAKMSIKYRNQFGETAAHLAAQRGNLNCLKLLLSGPLNRAQIVACEQDELGSTALHNAVLISENDVALWLLQRFGKSIANLSNQDGVLPLHIAAAQGNIEFIRIATKYDLQMVNRRDRNGATPAFYAAQGGHLQSLKYLVEKARADYHSMTAKGQSMLHAAALNGHISIVTWLLNRMDKNAVDQQTQDAATPFHFAAFSGQLGILKLIHKSSGRRKHLINATDRRGNTALHLSTINNHLACVRFLLDIGADVKSKNKMGQTALEIAEKRGHFQLYHFLHTTTNGKGSKFWKKHLRKDKDKDREVYGMAHPTKERPKSMSTSGYGSTDAASEPRSLERIPKSPKGVRREEWQMSHPELSSGFISPHSPMSSSFPPPPPPPPQQHIFTPPASPVAKTSGKKDSSQQTTGAKDTGSESPNRGNWLLKTKSTDFYAKQPFSHNQQKLRHSMTSRRLQPVGPIFGSVGVSSGPMMMPQPMHPHMLPPHGRYPVPLKVPVWPSNPQRLLIDSQVQTEHDPLDSDTVHLFYTDIHNGDEDTDMGWEVMEGVHFLGKPHPTPVAAGYGAVKVEVSGNRTFKPDPRPISDPPKKSKGKVYIFPGDSVEDIDTEDSAHDSELNGEEPPAVNHAQPVGSVSSEGGVRLGRPDKLAKQDLEEILRKQLMENEVKNAGIAAVEQIEKMLEDEPPEMTVTAQVHSEQENTPGIKNNIKKTGPISLETVLQALPSPPPPPAPESEYSPLDDLEDMVREEEMKEHRHNLLLTSLPSHDGPLHPDHMGPMEEEEHERVYSHTHSPLSRGSQRYSTKSISLSDVSSVRIEPANPHTPASTIFLQSDAEQLSPTRRQPTPVIRHLSPSHRQPKPPLSPTATLEPGVPTNPQNLEPGVPTNPQNLEPRGKSKSAHNLTLNHSNPNSSLKSPTSTLYGPSTDSSPTNSMETHSRASHTRDGHLEYSSPRNMKHASQHNQQKGDRTHLNNMSPGGHSNRADVRVRPIPQHHRSVGALQQMQSWHPSQNDAMGNAHFIPIEKIAPIQNLGGRRNSFDFFDHPKERGDMKKHPISAEDRQLCGSRVTNIVQRIEKRGLGWIPPEAPHANSFIPINADPGGEQGTLQGSSQRRLAGRLENQETDWNGRKMADPFSDAKTHYTKHHYPAKYKHKSHSSVNLRGINYAHQQRGSNDNNDMESDTETLEINPHNYGRVSAADKNKRNILYI